MLPTNRPGNATATRRAQATRSTDRLRAGGESRPASRSDSSQIMASDEDSALTAQDSKWRPKPTVSQEWGFYLGLFVEIPIKAVYGVAIQIPGAIRDAIFGK